MQRDKAFNMYAIIVAPHAKPAVKDAAWQLDFDKAILNATLTNLPYKFPNELPDGSFHPKMAEFLRWAGHNELVIRHDQSALDRRTKQLEEENQRQKTFRLEQVRSPLLARSPPARSPLALAARSPPVHPRRRPCLHRSHSPPLAPP